LKLLPGNLRKWLTRRELNQLSAQGAPTKGRMRTTVGAPITDQYEDAEGAPIASERTRRPWSARISLQAETLTRDSLKSFLRIVNSKTKYKNAARAQDKELSTHRSTLQKARE
jgi:hypothetical protein